MGHAPKQNLATDMLGCVIDAVRVTFGASGAPTVVDNGKMGLLDATIGCVKTATGRYTFQLAPNFYAKLVAALPSLSAATTTGAVQLARYLEASYNATTGVFEVDVTAAAALVDPTSGTALDLVLVFQRYSNL